MIVRSLADNTLATYKKNYKKFVTFVRSLRADFKPFPANHGLVVFFASHLFQTGYSLVM